MIQKKVYKIENYNSSPKKIFKGFLIYTVIFVIIVPYLLSINGFFWILKYYIPNVDMIASVLSYDIGILKHNLFTNIYDITPTTKASQISKIFINYFALLGLTYIVSKETYIHNSISIGWSIAFVMLLVSYLLPNNFINYNMDLTYNYLYDKTKNKNKSYNITCIIGFLIIFMILYFERFIIKLFRENIIQFIDFIKSF